MRTAWETTSGRRFALETRFLVHKMSIISVLPPGSFRGFSEIVLDSWSSWHAGQMSLLSYQSPLEGRKLFHRSGGRFLRVPSPLLPPPRGLASGFQIPPGLREPLRCSQVSHSGAPRPASPLSLLLFALSREVPPLATTLSYANQQDLDPVHRLLGPDPSPVFHPQNGLGQDATPGYLSPPASFTRRSGDPPGRIQTHPWGAEGWGREALLQ